MSERKVVAVYRPSTQPQRTFADTCVACRRMSDSTPANCRYVDQSEYAAVTPPPGVSNALPSRDNFWIWVCAHCGASNRLHTTCIEQIDYYASPSFRHTSPHEIIEAANRRNTKPPDTDGCVLC